MISFRRPVVESLGGSSYLVRYALGYRTIRSLSEGGVPYGSIGVERWDGERWVFIGSADSHDEARRVASRGE